MKGCWNSTFFRVCIHVIKVCVSKLTDCIYKNPSNILKSTCRNEHVFDIKNILFSLNKSSSSFYCRFFTEIFCCILYESRNFINPALGTWAVCKPQYFWNCYNVEIIIFFSDFEVLFCLFEGVVYYLWLTFEGFFLEDTPVFCLVVCQNTPRDQWRSGSR